LNGKSRHIPAMSSVAEIESAIEWLPMEQVPEVAAWLEEYQATVNASAEVATMLDAEEGDGHQWHDRQ
jgi:hypothetical protein